MLVFLWWWGAWLSALANIFYDLWFDLVVVDKYQSEITDKLKKKWVKVVIWDDKFPYSKDDVIIYSDAVIHSKDFEKVKKNRKFTYFQFLGEISKRFDTIAIAWTHWKTSTTSIFLSVAKDLIPNLWLGILWGFVPDLWNKNYYLNKNVKSEIKEIFSKILTAKWSRPANLFKKYYFVLEADEFNRHFLLLDPYLSLITKVDHDHKDIYPTEKDYFDAFKLFVSKTRYKTLTNDGEFKWKVSKDVKFVDINKDIEFDYIFWEHMKKNASLVLEWLKLLTKLNAKVILEKIRKFRWVWRRQEYLGKLKELKIYSDYAHHPVEIKATYEAFKKQFPDKNIYVIFQPHQLFRFVSYQKDFEDILKQIDNLIIYDIYSVREEELLKQLWKKEGNIWTEDTNPKEVVKTIWKKISDKVWALYLDNFDNLLEYLYDKNWIVVLMTAWDLDYKIRKIIIK